MGALSPPPGVVDLREPVGSDEQRVRCDDRIAARRDPKANPQTSKAVTW